MRASLRCIAIGGIEDSRQGENENDTKKQTSGHAGRMLV
jgi:hypothetical protein